MYVVIDLEEYRNITNLSFEPSADLAGTGIPINEFSVDIRTGDSISIGQYAELYGDDDTLWAKYWIIHAYRVESGTVRVRAQSDVALLERVTLPAVYYSGEDVSNVLDDTMVRNSGAAGIVAQMDYTLDSAFNGETITGFCPEQTARERLLWVCFVLGAYVKAFFNDEIEILPIDNAVTLIPIGDTYWKPTVNHNDWITAIRGKAYSFTVGTPQTTDQYVTDAQGTHYIISESEIVLQNPNAPSVAPENIMDIQGVYLLNDSNISVVLTHIAQWYFKSVEVDLDAINNGLYLPGDKVQVYANEETILTGFINSEIFTFGLQSKAAMHLTAVENTETGNLVVLYKYQSTQIGKRVYLFPVGYAYSITNPYIDLTMDRHRYIFRPLNAAATGTIAAGENTSTQNYDVALDLYDGILHIISVDEVTVTTDDIVIGKIA